MATHFIPPVGWHKRTLLSDTYADWLPTQDFDWFVTLNFNRPAAPTGARSQLKHWFACIDHEHLGSKWHLRGADRIFAFAVVEHPHSNIHLHALLRMPGPARVLGRPYQMASMADHWRKIEPGGSCCPTWIEEIEGVARYICKELPFPGHLEECIIISTDFHNNS